MQVSIYDRRRRWRPTTGKRPKVRQAVCGLRAESGLELRLNFDSLRLMILYLKKRRESGRVRVVYLAWLQFHEAHHH